MNSQTQGKSILSRTLSYLKYQFIRNPYLQGALAILSITIIFSFGYLISSGAPAGYSGDLLSTAPTLLDYLKGDFFSHWSNAYSEIANYGVLPGNLVLYLQFVFLFLSKNLYASFKILQIAELFCSSFFMFVFFYVLTKRKFDGVLAGVLYMLAPFNLVRLQGHTFIAWSFALLPLAYLTIYKALTEGKIKYAIIAGLPICYVLFLFPENIFLLGIPLLIFSLLISVIHGKLAFRSIMKKILFILIMFGMALWIGLTSFIAIIGNFFQSIYTGSYPILFLGYVYPNPPVAALFLFDGETLQMSTPLTQANVILIVLSCSFLLLSSICLITKRNSLNMSLFITGLLCVVLSMGVSAPSWLSLFDIARKYLPTFSGIITPGRFIMSSYFAFIFLAVIGLRSIFENIIDHKKILRGRILSRTKSYRLFKVILLVILLFVPTYLLSTTYSFSTAPVPSASIQTQQLLNTINPDNSYRAIDLISHSSILYVLGQRTLRYGWDLVNRFYNSPSFAEILGSMNIKYIVASNFTDEFVTGHDLNDVLSNSPDFTTMEVNGSTVYVNKLVRPEIYAGNGALIIGGPNALSLLYSLNGTNDYVPLYASQLINEDQQSLNQMENTSDLIVFHDSSEIDLAFQLMSQTYLLEPWEYVSGSDWSVINDNTGGTTPTAYIGSVDGQLNFAQYSIYTDKPAEIQIPYTVPQSGNYDIWVRARSDTAWESWSDPYEYPHFYPSLGATPSNNTVSVKINNSDVGAVNFAQYGGFEWVKVGQVYLSAGKTELEMSTSGNPIYIDSAAIVPQGLIENETSKVDAALDASSKPILYLLEFSNYFKLTGNATRAISLPGYTSDSESGYVALGQGGEANTTIYIAKEGNYTFQVRANSSQLNLLMDGKVLSASDISDPSQGWLWLQYNPLHLTPGYYNISAVPKILYSNNGTTASTPELALDEMEINTGNYSLQTSTSVVPQPTYSEVSLQEWEGTLNLSHPEYVVLSENIFPQWSLQLLGNKPSETLNPFPAYYVLNSFYINQTGIVSFKINYELPQVDNTAQLLVDAACVTWVVVLLITLMPTFKSIKKRFSHSK